MRTALLLLVATLSSLVFAQDDRPALITREQFSAANLLFASYRHVGDGFLISQGCLRISPDGSFHRENSKGNPPPKAKYAETGKLSDSDLSSLKTMLSDAEFQSYRQDPTRMPQAIRIDVGDEIFEISVFRHAEHQDLLFFNTATSTAEPPKVQALQKFVRDLLTRKDPAMHQVPANGCRANVKPATSQP